ncbi:hypothetical protein SAMN05421736_1212 [Evansella caseinilytica]|uniref:PKD domain-containing protein n=1 Tax=Evansella caseinilytica TaxID=1503961 RepID=A0A1H3UFD0_9BACI|nr:hypothetical protein [Evansella caseinilytica]SDZ61078.1 hypothetical protein SAMN05421736_1212 [Evansella caseinilytica]
MKKLIGSLVVFLLVSLLGFNVFTQAEDEIEDDVDVQAQVGIRFTIDKSRIVGTELARFTVSAVGGKPSYSYSFNAGDGSRIRTVQSSESSVPFTHRYYSNKELETYTARARVADQYNSSPEATIRVTRVRY